MKAGGASLGLTKVNGAPRTLFAIRNIGRWKASTHAERLEELQRGATY